MAETIAVHHWYDQKTRRNSGRPGFPYVPAIDYPVDLRYFLVDMNRVPPDTLVDHIGARAFAGLVAFKYVMRRLERQAMRLLLTASLAPEIRYTVDEGKRMKSVSDVLEERGFKRGIEQGLKQENPMCWCGWFESGLVSALTKKY